ncbi:MAG: T9SS type A sorting domain-containing protein [Ignavibacteria bacterium]|nr:T9SS type A sorting domain-containing protein [Ignavibacteria bacterium]
MKLALLLVLFTGQMLSAQTVFFRESFDDPNFTQRGWYDNATIPTTASEFHGAGGRAAEYIYRKGGTKAQGSAIRRQFTPSASVYLSYWVKYSANFVGSGKPYHPHEFNITTTLNDKYVGPAWTKMTLYVEQNNGYPLLAFQDGENIDKNNIKKDLTAITEARACAGCNGSGDTYPAGDCYQSGSEWRNGKAWKSTVRAFDNTGEYNKNEWHFIEAFFKLNSIEGGKGIANGVVQYWFDGKLLIDANGVMFRTATNPSMMFNQLLIAPYIGDGSPVEQTMWVDDVTVAEARSSTTAEESTNTPKWRITPNPAADHLHIEFGNKHDGTGMLILSDILGNVVCSQSTDDSKSQYILSTHHLPNGVYLLRLQLGSDVFTERVVVRR